MDLLYKLIHYLFESKDDSCKYFKWNNLYFIILYKTAASGLLHMISFMIMILSGEREFSIQLNKVFLPKISTPCVPKLAESASNYADFLAMVNVDYFSLQLFVYLRVSLI